MEGKPRWGRRSFCRGAGAIAGAALAGTVIPLRVAVAQQKASKKAMQYQDSPKNGQQCDQCMHFEPPKSCKIVEGDISPKGWCVAWAKKP
ncbi:MAG TPA: high-potential iron-sulfur protein [Usitatibacter sp.]|nr:high-potential iron-sulfur protein [Usitatibacter sp.]